MPSPSFHPPPSFSSRPPFCHLHRYCFYLSSVGILSRSSVSYFFWVNASAFFSYCIYSTPSTSSIVSTSTAATISNLCSATSPSFHFYFLPIFTPTSSSTLLSLQLPLLYSFHFYLALHFHSYYFSTTARTSISTLAFTSTSFPFRVLGRRSKQFSQPSSRPSLRPHHFHFGAPMIIIAMIIYLRATNHRLQANNHRLQATSARCADVTPVPVFLTSLRPSVNALMLFKCPHNCVPYRLKSQCRCADVPQVPTQTCSAGRHRTPTTHTSFHPSVDVLIFIKCPHNCAPYRLKSQCRCADVPYRLKSQCRCSS